MLLRSRVLETPFQYFLALVWLMIALAIPGCSEGIDSITGSDGYLPISKPMVELPPDVGRPFLDVANFDLADFGYIEEEFFVSGTASAFTSLNEFQPDGFWAAEPGEAASYKTRIVVIRPIEASDFSGTVMVEWINSALAWERAPIWITGHTGILREGHALVAVSALSWGVEGLGDDGLPLYLKAVNPDRYGSLHHPGNSFSYDIFSQVGEAIGNPEPIDLLGGLKAKQVLAVGSATAATYLVTYINAVHPLYDPYRGYLLRGRLGGSYPLSAPPQQPIASPETVRIRTDLNVPVLTLQSESDLFAFGFVDDRQEDSDLLRLWEIAGTSHTNAYTLANGINDTGDDPEYYVLKENNEGCDLPVNSAPSSWSLNTAISALSKWALNGDQPSIAERLVITDDMLSFQYDEYGNVLGGVRNPYVVVPAATLSGEGNTGPRSCSYRGTTSLFSQSVMASMYIDKTGYIQAVSEATEDAVANGFLLTPDAERVKAAASLQWDMLSN
jgi:hypothetical protein